MSIQQLKLVIVLVYGLIFSKNINNLLNRNAGKHFKHLNLLITHLKFKDLDIFLELNIILVKKSIFMHKYFCHIPNHNKNLKFSSMP